MRTPTTNAIGLLGFSLTLALGATASAQAGDLSAPTGDPAPIAAPAPAQAPATVPVRVAGGPPGTVVHRGQEELCPIPCDLQLPPGVHPFGVSLEGSGPIYPAPVSIDRPGTLRASYVSRSGTRISGWVLFGISTPLALLTGIPSVIGITSGSMGGVLAGIFGLIPTGINLILALAVGIPLAAVPDGATIRFD